MTIRVEGLAGVRSALAQLATKMHLGSKEGQLETAGAVAAQWRENAPVETGEHRDGISSDEDSAYATSDHSAFVEFGTSTHTAHHDGTTAAAQVARKMPGTVAVNVKRRL